MTFTDAFWICCSQFKQKNWNQNIINFEIATYRVLHERSNKTACLADHLKFHKQMTFTYVLLVKSGNLK